MYFFLCVFFLIRYDGDIVKIWTASFSLQKITMVKKQKVECFFSVLLFFLFFVFYIFTDIFTVKIL